MSVGDRLVCFSWRTQQHDGVDHVWGAHVRTVSFHFLVYYSPPCRPSIFWPFIADQPINALNMTYKHHAAYELMEVRLGDGLRPLHRTGKQPEGTLESVRREANEVLAKAFGPDGEEKRVNMIRLKERFEQAWSENGSAKRELDDFLESLKA